jgi:hypothetical protein
VEIAFTNVTVGTVFDRDGSGVPRRRSGKGVRHRFGR